VKRTIGLGILTFLPLLAATLEAGASVCHFLREQWPPHEMFRLLIGLSGLLATYALILVLV
jgi:predicted component of type VI protein secretion system